MIAQRFQSVAWVIGVAVAATLLYIISLQVATERGRLEQIDRKIAATRHDIRQLQTEMGTRASLRQLERWNGDVLALSAPSANQYLNSEDDIDQINHNNLGVATTAPPPAMASVLLKEKGETAQASIPSQSPPTTQPTPTQIALSKQDRAVQREFGASGVPSKALVRVAAAKAVDGDAKSGVGKTSAGGKSSQ